MLCFCDFQLGDGIPSEQIDGKEELCPMEMHLLSTPESPIHQFVTAETQPMHAQQGKGYINIMEISQGPIFPIEKGIAFLRHVGKERLIKHKTFPQTGSIKENSNPGCFEKEFSCNKLD